VVVAGWRQRRVGRSTLLLAGILEAIVVSVALAACQYTQPVPAPLSNVVIDDAVLVPAAPGIDWPDSGQSALAIDDLRVVAIQDANAPAQPIASTTKVMTALLLLEGHPIGPDDEGPTISITADDADAFIEAILNDESAVEVREGEDLTLRQVLDGILVASANNYARIAARWDAGSEEAFVAKMNARARTLGMSTTSFADSSGISPANTSTAADLLLLARAAMTNETFARIVAQEMVELPVVGEVDSTNSLLSIEGVVGIKTGETDEAGACLVFAADVETAVGRQRVIGAVLGQPERQLVFENSQALLAEAAARVRPVEVVSRGQTVGNVTTRWEATVPIVTAEAIEVPAWSGEQLTVTLETAPLEAPIGNGDAVGELTVQRDGVTIATTPVVAGGDLDTPGLRWRLLRD